MKINKVLNILESWMPKAISEDFDNVGLIIGNSSKELQSILVTLDSTVDVIEEAIEKNCNLIISYHPIIFEGIKKINEQEDYVQKAVIKAIENKICIYAIHTSMDNHENGISYSLAKILGLNKTSILIPKEKKINNLKIGMGTIGYLSSELSEDKFLKLVKNSIKNSLIRHSKMTGKKISKVAIVAGSGSFAIDECLNNNVDALITSDLKYHNFFMGTNKILLLDIGHFESEKHIKLIIQEYLKKKLPNFTILLSEKNVNPVNYY
ncbi:MAG: Nif3-like dinuclear metal center hexameric protein [Flavobacteriales bacterium]|jgi:dinuclear metal center YbgI/SA1388 family protein|nr:Nif3-like dinuclear metal center hexameric protein [Flavobacteriales bacterium]